MKLVSVRIPTFALNFAYRDIMKLYSITEIEVNGSVGIEKIEAHFPRIIFVIILI